MVPPQRTGEQYLKLAGGWAMAHLSAYLDTRKASRGQMERRDRRRGLWIDAYSLHEAYKAFGRTQVQVAKAIGVS